MLRDFVMQKRLILAGLAVLLLADGTLAYFSMKMAVPREEREKMLLSEGRQVALVKADVERAKKIQQNLPDVLKRFDDFEGTLLPASKGYSVILQEVDEYAKDAHVVNEGVNFKGKDVTGRNLSEVEIDSTVEGDYNGIVVFLNHLQRSKNVYIVDALAVDSQNPAQGQPGGLRVSLHLRTYFRKA
ncbi:MAG TPA: type 4a pilus biogenesis protein PilO [Methylomirabilota bacterium]|nr:type 4a pilus biogenesis protein PilO [Methylomirabilota bacterium]